MVRITLLDGTKQDIPRTELKRLKPFRPLLKNPRLKSDGLVYEGGRLYPVHGPLPEASDFERPHAEQPWLLFAENSVRVVRGLPTFSDDTALNIVPVRAAASSAAKPAAEAPAAPRAVAAPHPAPALSEEEEELQLMQELEDLLKAA